MTPFLAVLALLPSMSSAPSADHSKLDALVEMAWAQTAAQSQADKKHQEAIQRDKDQGKQYSVLAEKDLKLSKDEAMIARLQKIGAEIAAIANKNKVTATWGDKDLNQFDYTFKLVEDKDINAFSLP